MFKDYPQNLTFPIQPFFKFNNNRYNVCYLNNSWVEWSSDWQINYETNVSSLSFKCLLKWFVMYYFIIVNVKCFLTAQITFMYHACNETELPLDKYTTKVVYKKLGYNEMVS